MLLRIRWNCNGCEEKIDVLMQSLHCEPNEMFEVCTNLLKRKQNE